MKIGIIGAMEVEVESLKSAMTVKRTISKASMDFYEGSFLVQEVHPPYSCEVQGLPNYTIPH